jgi:hypothetical protein
MDTEGVIPSMDLAGDASPVVPKDPERPKTPPTLNLETVADNTGRPFAAKDAVEGPFYQHRYTSGRHLAPFAITSFSLSASYSAFLPHLVLF